VNTTLITNIGELVTNSSAIGDGILGVRSDAALVIENGKVAWVGEARSAPAADQLIDAAGAAVIPGFVDSHAHPVFAGDRAAEFAARMAGEGYSGGGIRTTVGATRAASETQLEANLVRLKQEFHRAGVTTFEAKSGYGLTVADELRSLEIAARHTTEVTFLGAHLVAPEFAENPNDYVNLVAGEMLAGAAKTAKWIDVFCDRGAFDVDQARTILTAGIAAGLKPRIHANQLTRTEAVQLAVELDCASADHCTHLNQADIDALANSNTVATLLPGAEFSTRSPYPDARALVDAGVTVAIATDCNPGSSYTTSMAFCIAVAVREMRLSPAEALRAATAGGAKALRRTDIGHLSVGARADLAILTAPSFVHLAYRPGVPLISKTIIEGKTA
jgi:imidazolonepropionase